MRENRTYESVRGARDEIRVPTATPPYPAHEMTCCPVSPRVGSVKNNDPSLIEPIAAK